MPAPQAANHSPMISAPIPIVSKSGTIYRVESAAARHDEARCRAGPPRAGRTLRPFSNDIGADRVGSEAQANPRGDLEDRVPTLLGIIAASSQQPRRAFLRQRAAARLPAGLIVQPTPRSNSAIGFARRVLAQVHGGEVEAEGARRGTAGATAVRQQRPSAARGRVDHVEVLREAAASRYSASPTDVDAPA